MPDLKGKIGQILADLAAAGHAVGLANVAGAAVDARKRVRAGHRAMARAAGMEDVIDAEAGGEDMRINIGDVTNPPAPPAVSPSVWPSILAAVGLLAGGGLGGAGLLALLVRQAVPAIVVPAPLPEPKPAPKPQGFILELVPIPDGK